MRKRWLAPASVKLHVIAVVSVAAMMGLFVWQLNRALAGNSLSWAYTVEWPLFAIYTVYMWWRLLHEQPEFAGTKSALRRKARAERKKAEADERAVTEEAELAAYNEYLSQLSERRSAEK
jgi:hypothetical protein